MSQPSERALLHYKVVSSVISRVLRGESRADAVRAVAAINHVDPRGKARRVSARSIYRWLRAFEERDAGPTVPPPSLPPPTSTLPAELIDFVRAAKIADASASIPELIQRAREKGVINRDLAVDRTTVWRTCRRIGVPVARGKKTSRGRDSRRFAYPHCMDMVLCDGKHFRAGATRKKRVVMYFLDDATRKVLHGVVGASESSGLFLRGLFETMRCYGRMTALYLDHGPGYIADDTLHVARQLGILVIHGEVAYPQGHGKIERFNRTLHADLLRTFDGRPDVDPDYRALELRLEHYARDVYGRRPHTSLGEETPTDRFNVDKRPLRFVEESLLRRAFLIPFVRRVANDHVVSVGSVHYEMPRGYAGRKVTLTRDILDGSLSFLHRDRRIELHPVDLHANARSLRARRDAQHDNREVDHPLPKSAADLRFDHDFGRVAEDHLSNSDEETR